MNGDVLEILVQDCMTHRLTERESLEYIKTRYKEVSYRTLRRRKKEIESDKSLDIYFNEHTRIGFVKDQRERMNEMKAVIDQLMRQWKALTSKKDVDIHKMVRLSDAITNANKRLEEISLSNPVISQIKSRIDIVEAGKTSREDNTR